MSNDSIWKSNSCKFSFVFVFDMASLTGEKRKIQSRTNVEKYKILKEIEKGESCAAVSCKHSIPKQTLSGWMKEKSKIYDAVEKINHQSINHQLFKHGSPFSKAGLQGAMHLNATSTKKQRMGNGYEDILCF